MQKLDIRKLILFLREFFPIDYRSWAQVIENRKHKNLSSFFSNSGDVFGFSELVNNSWTRPKISTSVIVNLAWKYLFCRGYTG